MDQIDWDHTFKWLLMEILGTESLDIEVFPELEIGKRPPRIDILLVNDHVTLTHYEGVLGFFIRSLTHYNYIEFKSITDTVDEGELKRLAGHWGHYGDQQQIEWMNWLTNSHGYLFVSKCPSKLKEMLENHFRKKEEGIYYSPKPFP